MNQAASDTAESEVIVLGAGIAGLHTAAHLVRRGHRVTVIERDAIPGGAHRSHNIGPYSFDYGSIFYEENAALFDLADGLREMCPKVFRRQRRIGPSGEIMHYPIEPRDIIRSAPLRFPLNVSDMMVSRLLRQRDGTLDAILKQRLGKGFYVDTGLRDYVTRFHHVPPECVDEQFFFKRMAFIDRFTRSDFLWRAAWRSLLLRKTINSKGRRALRVRPLAGFEELFDPIRRRLERSGVRFRFGETVERIERLGPGFRVRCAGGSYEADSVVSTIPLETVHRAMFGEDSGLVSLDMTTLFVSAEQLDPAAGNVLFNFHREGDWKRATIYSRLYPDAPTDREFFSVEVTIAAGSEHEPERAFADFAKHIGRLGLASDMRLEGSAFLPGCYPMLSPGAEKQRARVLARIAENGVIAVGRQGRFEYLPTSSAVIRRVREELSGLYGPPEKPGPDM